jgi:hypothetical protein
MFDFSSLGQSHDRTGPEAGGGFHAWQILPVRWPNSSQAGLQVCGSWEESNRGVMWNRFSSDRSAMSHAFAVAGG